MATAKLIYNEFCDMDYMDYEETREDDILLIQSLIECYGADETRQILSAYFD